MQRRFGWAGVVLLAAGKCVLCRSAAYRCIAGGTINPDSRFCRASTFDEEHAPVAGQQKTCAGPHQKTFDLDVVETTGVDLGMGITFAAWTYNGRIPGPTIEACQGDTVTINVHNKGTTSHGLDTHALKIDARHYGPRRRTRR